MVGRPKPPTEPPQIRPTERAIFEDTMFANRNKFFDFIRNFMNWTNLKPAMKSIASQLKGFHNWLQSFGKRNVTNDVTLYNREAAIANAAIGRYQNTPDTDPNKLKALGDAVIALAPLMPRVLAHSQNVQQNLEQLDVRLNNIGTDLNNKYP